MFWLLVHFLCANTRSKLQRSGFIMWPAAVGEIGIALWLLVMGVRKPAAA
jgi:hypothetical protein